MAALGGNGAAFVFGLCSRRVQAGLLNLLIERLLRVVEPQLLVLLLNAGVADAVARLEAVEDGHAQVKADVLREIVLQLGAESVGGESARGVVVTAQTAAEAERGQIARLRNLDAVVSGTQAQLLGGNLRLDAQGLGVDDVGGGDSGTAAEQRTSHPILPILPIQPIRPHHSETVSRRQFEELGERENGELLVVVGLGGGESAVGERGLLLRELGTAGLAVVDQCLEADHLH